MGGKKLSEDELKWARKELEDIQLQFKKDRCHPKKKPVAAVGAIVPVVKMPFIVNAPGNFCLMVEMDMSMGNERAVVTADFFRRQVRQKRRKLVQNSSLSPSVQPCKMCYFYKVDCTVSRGVFPCYKGTCSRSAFCPPAVSASLTAWLGPVAIL